MAKHTSGTRKNELCIASNWFLKEKPIGTFSLHESEINHYLCNVKEVASVVLDVLCRGSLRSITLRETPPLALFPCVGTRSSTDLFCSVKYPSKLLESSAILFCRFGLFTIFVIAIKSRNTTLAALHVMCGWLWGSVHRWQYRVIGIAGACYGLPTMTSQ